MLCFYGDPVYHLRQQLMGPFRGAANTPLQDAWNISMSQFWTSVEWIFRDIINNFRFFEFKKGLQLKLSPVGKNTSCVLWCKMQEHACTVIQLQSISECHLSTLPWRCIQGWICSFRDDFFDQSENSLCKPKAFHKWTYSAKNLLLRSALQLKKLRFQGISPHACAVPELVRRRRSQRRILNSLKTPKRRHWHRSGVCIVKFELISHLFLVFLLLALNK